MAPELHPKDLKAATETTLSVLVAVEQLLQELLPVVALDTLSTELPMDLVAVVMTVAAVAQVVLEQPLVFPLRRDLIIL